ncbi:MAG: heparinase II/III family protein, partial [Candidatus Krumholzibacteria bacterium]
MKTIWSKITSRTALLRARYHYERRQENLEPRNVEERLHPRLRGRFQAPAYYTQLFKTWLNESPRDPRVYKKEYVTAGADALRMGKIELFGKELDTAGGVDWHKDPLFNVAWPRKYVGALSGDQRGSDAVVLWHLNKMMFLLDASYACRVAGDEEFGRRWLGWVDSWVEQNPFMVGMNWRSPLEIGT